MLENKDIIENIKKFILLKNLSVRDFEYQCRLKSGLIGAAFKNNGAIGSDKILKILETFPELDANWLLTGVGEMILEKGQKNGHYISLLDSKLPVPLENQFVFPFLGDASAGFIVEYYEHEAYMESFQLPFQKGQNIRAFVIHGDSMYPLLNQGDIIFCKRVLDFTIHRFMPKDMYVITSHIGISVKHVRQTESGLRLISANQNYREIEMPGSEVYEVWRVHGKYSVF